MEAAEVRGEKLCCKHCVRAMSSWAQHPFPVHLQKSLYRLDGDFSQMLLFVFYTFKTTQIKGFKKKRTVRISQLKGYFCILSKLIDLITEDLENHLMEESACPFDGIQNLRVATEKRIRTSEIQVFSQSTICIQARNVIDPCFSMPTSTGGGKLFVYSSWRVAEHFLYLEEYQVKTVSNSCTQKRKQHAAPPG